MSRSLHALEHPLGRRQPRLYSSGRTSELSEGAAGGRGHERDNCRFIVNHDGIVYQKDLGPDSVTLAKQITRYNPDKTWIRTNDAWAK